MKRAAQLAVATTAIITGGVVLQGPRQPKVQVADPVVQAVATPGAEITGVYAPDGIGNGYQDYKLWLPKHGKPAPLIIFNLGGGWMEPAPLPKKLPASFEPWVDAGFAFALCRYTWTSEQFFLGGEFPAAEQDAQRAIQHFRHHARRLTINPDAICAMGRSAGAHNMLWAMLRQDIANERLEGQQGSKSSKPNVVLLRALALSHLPANLQHQFSSGVKHYVSTGKLKDLSIGDQLNASATRWIDEAAPGSVDIPLFLTSGSQELIYSTDYPYPANAIGFNHDPWNAAVVWARLQELGGVHVTDSVYVSLFDTPIAEDDITKRQIRWTRAMLKKQGHPVPQTKWSKEMLKVEADSVTD